MKQLNNVSFVSIDNYQPDWIGLCLDAALTYEQWAIESREDKTLMPSASKSVSGMRYLVRCWWSADSSLSRVDGTADGASYLILSVEPAEQADARLEVSDALRQALVDQIERLKPGTVADLPFDAGGGCVENDS